MELLKKIDKTIQALDRFQNQVEKNLLQIVKRNEAEGADLITEGQLFQGKDGKGRKIKPEYSPMTVQIKKSRGQPFNKVTLKDEGDFYRSVFARAEKFPVYFDSNDPKSDKLHDKYGDHILTMSRKSNKEFSEIVSDDVTKMMQKGINDSLGNL